jgi:mycothiol synthase
MRMRAPRPEDAEAVLELIVARDVADLGVPDYTLEDLRDEWALNEVDLERDAVVVEDDDGALVGYAIVRALGAMVSVPPAHEGRGIGTMLFRWAHDRSPRRRRWIGARNTAGQALLARAGYEPVRHYWRMRRALDAPVPPAPDVGVALRPLDPVGDAEAAHALKEAAFATTADHMPESLEEFREHHLTTHDFAPELSLLAVRDGRPVGFLIADRWEDGTGWVELLGVDPPERGRRIGEALLLTAFAAFRAAGLRSAQLGVASDNPRALRLYERVGMTQGFRVDVFEYKANDATPTAAGTSA